MATRKKTPKLPAMYLVTTASERDEGRKIKPGRLKTGAKRDSLRAYDVEALCYHALTSAHSDYLEYDRVFPLEFDEDSNPEGKKGGLWKFDHAVVGAPRMLNAVDTWTQFLADGVRLTPKKNTQPSILCWAAGKGYLAVLRALVEGGVGVNDGGKHTSNALVAAVGGQHRDAARYLIEQGLDAHAVMAIYASYGHEPQMKVLEDLGIPRPRV